MRIDVCIPVGPGHSLASERAARSVPPVANVEVRRLFDTKPEGRSATRNKLAQEAKGDWILWLDADDQLLPGSLIGIEKELEGYDAVWGAISTNGKLREPQAFPASYEDLIGLDPYQTLQIGFFVRREVALAEPWNESMDTGEDFEMYLRLWKSYRCKKIWRSWYDNRTGNHSTGPRSANGRQWRAATEALLAEARAELQQQEQEE